MDKTARKCAVMILNAGARKRKWTPYQRKQWTRAFNALQRLAGAKLVLEGGKLVKARRR